jgi:hypothetical protein
MSTHPIKTKWQASACRFHIGNLGWHCCIFRLLQRFAQRCAETVFSAEKDAEIRGKVNILRAGALDLSS